VLVRVEDAYQPLKRFFLTFHQELELITKNVRNETCRKER